MQILSLKQRSIAPLFILLISISTAQNRKSPGKSSSDGPKTGAVPSTMVNDRVAGVSSTEAIISKASGGQLAIDVAAVNVPPNALPEDGKITLGKSDQPQEFKSLAEIKPISEALTVAGVSNKGENFSELLQPMTLAIDITASPVALLEGSINQSDLCILLKTGAAQALHLLLDDQPEDPPPPEETPPQESPLPDETPEPEISQIEVVAPPEDPPVAIQEANSAVDTHSAYVWRSNVLNLTSNQKTLGVNSIKLGNFQAYSSCSKASLEGFIEMNQDGTSTGVSNPSVEVYKTTHSVTLKLASGGENASQFMVALTPGDEPPSDCSQVYAWADANQPEVFAAIDGLQIGSYTARICTRTSEDYRTAGTIVPFSLDPPLAPVFNSISTTTTEATLTVAKDSTEEQPSRYRISAKKGEAPATCEDTYSETEPVYWTYTDDIQEDSTATLVLSYLNSGSYKFLLCQYDAAWNRSGDISGTFTIPSPAAPSITSISVNTVSATIQIQKDPSEANPVRYRVSAKQGSEPVDCETTYLENENIYWTYTDDIQESGSGTLSLTGLGSGTYKFIACAYDAAWNRSASVSGGFTIPTPEAPSYGSITATTNSATIPVSKGETEVSNPIRYRLSAIVGGTAPSDCEVTGVENETVYWAYSDTINEDGSASLELIGLQSGSYKFILCAYDSAWNRSAPISGIFSIAAPGVPNNGSITTTTHSAVIPVAKAAAEANPIRFRLSAIVGGTVPADCEVTSLENETVYWAYSDTINEDGSSSLEMAGLKTGSYNFSLCSYDSAWNRSGGKAGTFVISQPGMPIVASIDTPTDPDSTTAVFHVQKVVTEDKPWRYRVSAQQGSAPADCEATDSVSWNLTDEVAENGNATLTLTELSSGTYYYKLCAYDSAQNRSLEKSDHFDR